jgi:adenylate cyclase
MAEEGFKRKLTAILNADVVGYSRLMDDNEEATIQTLNIYRNSMTTLIEQHRGRVVDMTGDNLLAEFTSVVDAVGCSVHIQQKLDEQNKELPPERKMNFRIGVNVGDVIEEQDRIYGDGVNIAARVESMAEAGGICITGRAYDQVKNKLELGYEFLGEHSVKNIAEPVRIYKVLTEPDAAGKVIGEKKFLGRISRRTALATIITLAVVAGSLIGWNIYLQQSKKVEPASVEKMTLPLPDKPSIAVLAFDNLTGDPSQEYFSDGIAEEIITILSNVGELFVIARNSSFSYKGKPVKIQQISEELGVRYVLEGSVRRSGDRVRVTAQLIDAIKGQHLWAKSYDRDLKNIFEIQDEITMKIVTDLRIKLTDGEQARIVEKESKNPDVYLKFLQAHKLWRDGTKESLLRYGQLVQEIVDIQPEYPHGYSALGWYHYELMNQGISPQESREKAFKLAQKALSIDESDVYAHALLGYIYLSENKIEKAIESGNRAVEIHPNGAMVHMILGSTLSYAGRIDEAIVYLKQAIRLNPFPAWYYYVHLGRCYLQMGQYEEALMELKKAHQRNPNAYSTNFWIAINYILLDREEEARASAVKTIELHPKLSVGFFLKYTKFKNQAFTMLCAGAMRKAGFPE